jgi:hypothetical protein
LVQRDGSGSFAAANISGSFAGNAAGLTNLNASQLTSGTVPYAALPCAVITNNNAFAVGISNDLTVNTNLTVSNNVTIGGTISGNGSGLTSLNASQLTSGIVPTPQLGAGAANSSTFLRGDQVWANISGGSGGGTVTSVTFTGDGTVLSSTPSSAVTSAGTLTAALANAPANTVLAGPSSGGAGAPSYQSAPTFSGANLTSLNASAISRGTVPYAQLPSGLITNANAGPVILSGPVTISNNLTVISNLSVSGAANHASFVTNNAWVFFGGSSPTVSTNGTNMGSTGSISLGPNSRDQAGLLIFSPSAGISFNANQPYFTFKFGTSLPNTNYTVTLFPMSEQAARQNDLWASSVYISSFSTTGFSVSSYNATVGSIGQLWGYFVAPYH